MALSDNVILEDAKILFRNFAGQEKLFNSEGDRNFCVYLDSSMAEKLAADGWNIKYTAIREEGDEARPYVQVKVNYSKGRPPRIVLVTSTGRVDLGMEEIGILDYAYLKLVDLVLNPYPWTVGDKSGVKAYLKNGFFTLDENELDLKYAELPDSNPTKTSHLSSTVNEVA